MGEDPVEGRRQRGGAAAEGDMDSTQRLEAVYTKLRRIAEKAKQDPQLQFTSLAHLLTVELLGFLTLPLAVFFAPFSVKA